MYFTAKNLVLAVLASIAFFPVSAQDVQFDHTTCATEVTAESFAVLNKLAEDAAAYVPEKTLTTVPVTAHIIRQSNNTGGATIEVIEDAIAMMNTQYADVEIEFFLCGTNTIADDAYFNFSKNDEQTLTSTYNVPNTINLYVANTVSSTSGAGLCGFTHYPGEAGNTGDQIFMSKICIGDQNTLAHEMGHYLGLYHTHGIENTTLTDELNSGENCIFAGDGVCDTPSDPNLFGKVADCEYTGTSTDANGDTFAPDVNNIMSYAPSTCRQHFSTGQLNRAAYVLKTERDYLACGGLNADFMADVTYSACGDPLTVTFTATNTAATTWTWNFGDGLTTSNETSTITYTYNTPGIYSVSLTVGDGTNYVSKTKPNFIQIKEITTVSHTDDFSEGTTDWSIINNDGGNTWLTIHDFAYTDNIVLCINNYDNNQQNQEDVLQSRSFDMTGWTAAILSFDISYMPLYYTPDFYLGDELEVQYSIDCGATYQSIYNKSGSDLKTTNTISDQRWYPISDSDWRTEVIELPSELLGELVSFRIINRSGQGNYLYFDNFSVENSAAALPAELIDFTALAQSKGEVELNWTTATERNVSHFEVEYSTNNQDWVKRGQVQAISNSDTEQDYSFRSVFTSGEISFRLKIEDLDGTFTYSDVQRVRIEDNSTIQVFPNPTQDYIKVQATEYQEFNLTDMTGKTIRRFQTDANGASIVDLNNLSKGIYFLQSGNMESIKVVKL